MTKSDIIAAVAKETEMTKVEAQGAVNALLDTIKEALKKGDKVSLVGFGSFEVSKRKARTGVNPQTGEKIKIKATKVPKFRPGNNLKTAIN